MSRLTINGASDDLIEFGGAIDEEFSSYDKPWRGRLIAPNGEGLTVVVSYVGEGVWAVGVAQFDEDRPLPDWDIRIQACTDPVYSAQLVMDIPRGTLVVEVDE